MSSVYTNDQNGFGLLFHAKMAVLHLGKGVHLWAWEVSAGSGEANGSSTRNQIASIPTPSLQWVPISPAPNCQISDSECSS